MIIKSIRIRDYNNLLQLLWAKIHNKRILKIGEHSYGKPKVLFDTLEYTVQIGKFCSIAKNVTFILSGAHKIDYISTYPFSILFKSRNIQTAVFHKGNIIVENDVWIGYGATIMPGITIGNGVVIGAMSVVTKNVEPYSIVAGNPAKLIRKRFNDKVISNLLKIEWWNWKIEKVQENTIHLSSEDVDFFIEKQLNIKRERNRK